MFVCTDLRLLRLYDCCVWGRHSRHLLDWSVKSHPALPAKSDGACTVWAYYSGDKMYVMCTIRWHLCMQKSRGVKYLSNSMHQCTIKCYINASFIHSFIHSKSCYLLNPTASDYFFRSLRAISKSVSDFVSWCKGWANIVQTKGYEYWQKHSRLSSYSLPQ